MVSTRSHDRHVHNTKFNLLAEYLQVWVHEILTTMAMERPLPFVSTKIRMATSLWSGEYFSYPFLTIPWADRTTGISGLLILSPS